MTMERLIDYPGKEGSHLSERRNITKGRKDDDHGKEGRLPREGRRFTKGRKEVYQRKINLLNLLKPFNSFKPF